MRALVATAIVRKHRLVDIFATVRKDCMAIRTSSTAAFLGESDPPAPNDFHEGSYVLSLVTYQSLLFSFLTFVAETLDVFCFISTRKTLTNN